MTSGGAPLRVAIVDDHPIVLSGLEAALTSIGRMTVVARGRSIVDALAILERSDVDVILLDVRLPDGNGLQLLSTLGSDRPPVIVLSSFRTSQYVSAAVRFGARGFLLKTAPIDELISAIEVVADGGTTFTASELVRAPQEYVALTERQREILRLVLAGRSNDEIGAELAIARKTVESHLARMFERFGTFSRTELALRAERGGWLEIDELAPR